MAFPPGITVEGATLKRGGEVVDFGVHHLPLPGGAPAPKIGGSLPPIPPPPVWRHDAPCEGVDTRCRHRTGLYPIGLGQSAPTRVQCGFPGTTWTTTARASPSESGALGLLKGRATTCATSVRHPPFVSGPPIRRHGRDPRRRKSSIISRPLEAGSSCSHWTIFSMTKPRPSWRSVVHVTKAGLGCGTGIIPAAVQLRQSTTGTSEA